MKILMSNGSVEEGERLEEYAASFLLNLEAYLHRVVCGANCHSTCIPKPCREAAVFLMKLCTTRDKVVWGAILEKELSPKDAQPEKEAEQ